MPISAHISLQQTFMWISFAMLEWEEYEAQLVWSVLALDCIIHTNMSQISVSCCRLVSPEDLHTTPTTQTSSGTILSHTSSIFHSHMKYAWMCARHLPSLGFCSPQGACLICNWEVCWINQQFISFLIEITISKKKKKHW